MSLLSLLAVVKVQTEHLGGGFQLYTPGHRNIAIDPTQAFSRTFLTATEDHFTNDLKWDINDADGNLLTRSKGQFYGVESTGLIEDPAPIQPVPIPAAFPMLLTALGGLGLFLRQRKRAA